MFSAPGAPGRQSSESKIRGLGARPPQRVWLGRNAPSAEAGSLTRAAPHPTAPLSPGEGDKQTLGALMATASHPPCLAPAQGPQPFPSPGCRDSRTLQPSPTVRPACGAPVPAFAPLPESAVLPGVLPGGQLVNWRNQSITGGASVPPQAPLAALGLPLSPPPSLLRPGLILGPPATQRPASLHPHAP